VISGIEPTWPPLLQVLLGHEGRVLSVAFSPDGTVIVSGSADKTVRVWNAVTGQEALLPLEGHNHWVCSVAFSPDGTKIVSGSRDKTVRVWDAVTGQ
ncbi:WD40 repeat-like protein, partial [Athelia psychrophila]